MQKKVISFEKIREHIDIVDIVSQYLNLKRSGANFTALCPFHTEKTPSFVVSPQKQIFHCFGCGKGGDVIKFISEIEGLDYFDAALKLAKDYNIDIDFKKNSKINAFFEITKVIADIYHDFLKKSYKLAKVKNFIKNRKISDEIIEKFYIGYAPENSKFLIKELKKKNIDLNIVKEIGIIKKDRDFYDAFRDRIIFPIRNLKGEFIAFGGRTLNDKIQPKYLNSPESPIYHKRKNLYGLFENKEVIKKEQEAIIVEGYMDMISLYSNKIENSVATLGTSFTQEQLNLLSRFTDNLIFLYDGDKAGTKAAIRAAIMAINKDFNPKIIYLPDNNDPDDFINKNGKEEFFKLKDNASDLVNFLKNIIFSSINLKNFENRIRLMDRLKKIYLDIDNPLYKDHFIKGCSEILDLDYNEVKNYIIKAGTNRKYNQPQQVEQIKLKVEEEVVGIILKNNNYLAEVESEFFLNTTYKKLINLLKEGNKFLEIIDSNNFTEQEKYILRYLALSDRFDKLNDNNLFNNLLKRLKKNYFEYKLRNITKKIKDKEIQGDEETIFLLMNEQKQLINEIKKLD